MAALKNLIVVLVMCSSSCICLAQQVATLIPGASNLLIQTTPSISPYSLLLNFNASLTQQGTGAAYTVPVSRHPVISLRTLSLAYNAAITNGHLRTLAPLMETLSNNIRQYAGNGGVNCADATIATGIVQASNLALGQATGWVYAQSNARPPPGRDQLGQYFIWMPGNLFIGPTNRGDRLHEQEFDHNAIHVVGRPHWLKLNQINVNLVQYINTSNISFLTAAVLDMNTLASTTSSQVLVGSRWELRNGQYFINTSLPTSIPDVEETSQSNAALNSAACNGLTPTFRQMRARLTAALFKNP